MPEEKQQNPWPFDFPGCPPDGAKSADRIYYRGVNNHPPQRDDFLSYLEEGRTWRPGPMADCNARGISLFETREGVKRLIRRVKGFKPRYIAKGRLTPEHGVIQLGSSRTGHTTWWPYREAARESAFSVQEPSGA